MKRVLTLIVLVYFPATTQAQPEALWTKTYEGNGLGMFHSMEETTDGGFVLGGVTYGPVSGDFWLVRTDTNGDTLWTRTYGGTSLDYARDIDQTSDGGYILIGTTYSFGPGGIAFYVVKTDSIGNMDWQDSYGSSGLDRGLSIAETDDGSYLLTGELDTPDRDTQMWIVKIDSSGGTLWTKSYGGNNQEAGRSLRKLNTGGYIIAGWTESFGAGGINAWLVRIADNGDTLWTRTYGGEGREIAIDVRQTSDGGFIIVGLEGIHSERSENILLIKTNSFGDTLWTYSYDGGGQNDEGHSVIQTSDGGYIFTGFTIPYFNAGARMWLVRTNSIGDTLWTKMLTSGWGGRGTP